MTVKIKPGICSLAKASPDAVLQTVVRFASQVPHPNVFFSWQPPHGYPLKHCLEGLQALRISIQFHTKAVRKRSAESVLIPLDRSA